MGAAREKKTLEPGAKAPDFELDDLLGHTRTLRDLAAGKPLLLAFFKISCPVCQFTFPFLERMYRAAGNRAAIYAISQDDAESTRKFHEEFGITIPTLLDRGENGYPASNAFGLSYVPSLFLIDPDGKISWTLIGFGKKDLQTLGQIVGAEPFLPGEYVPEWKSG